VFVASVLCTFVQIALSGNFTNTETVRRNGNFRYQLKIDGQVLPAPKICSKKESGGKRILFFFLLRPKKGRQALSAGNGRHEVAEVRAQRLLGG